MGIDWKNKKVLVTGGTGFIGSNLVARLIEMEVDLALFVLDEETPLPENVTIFRGNIQDAPDVERTITRFQPEYVFHLASQPLVDTALINVYDTLDSNIRGTINLLQSCVAYAKHLKGMVVVSTDKVYGDSFTGKVDENSPLLGTGHPYEVSKTCADLIAQMYARVFSLPIVISRSGNIYGKGDRNWDRLIPGAFKSAMTDIPPIIRSNGKYIRDYIYVEDIVDGYLLLMDGLLNGKIRNGTAINFGSNQSTSVLDIVHLILKITGKISLAPIVQNSAKFEIPNQTLNWEWARELGWEPKTPIEIGLEKSYEWYKNVIK